VLGVFKINKEVTAKLSSGGQQSVTFQQQTDYTIAKHNTSIELSVTE
jgi:hypothetical protein